MGKHASKKPKRQQRGGHRKPVMSSAKAKKATKNGPARGAAANALTQAELGPSTSKNLFGGASANLDTKKQPPNAGHQRFKKLKDDLLKKSPKRLQKKSKPNKIKNIKYMDKLVSSIKKKYEPQTKFQHIKRRLDFQADSKMMPTKLNALPKPKFYRPAEICNLTRKLLNETIEDGEIVEELNSSCDSEDCVILETSIPIDENEDEDKPSFSRDKLMFRDCKRRGELLIAAKSDNDLHYDTIEQLKPIPSDTSCIIIDDTIEMPKPRKIKDDSVILIEDSIMGEDFIPLPKEEPKVKRAKTRKSSEPNAKKPNKRMNDSLFTSAEKKQLSEYNVNTFNPTEESETESGEGQPKSHKRPIVIDGSNVAFGHGNSNIFSAEGIKYCLQYFEKMGHNVKAVIPMFRKNPTKSSNPELLDRLHKEGKIVFTPCKNLPGQMSTSYDDRFILQIAYELNAAVVSNDNYRDLIHENPAFKKIIENRVIGYSWCDNMLILAKDPYGRWGPKLDEILRC